MLRSRPATRLAPSRRLVIQRTRPASAAVTQPARIDAERQVFDRLLTFIGTDAKVTLGETPAGNGLVLTQDVNEGEVLLRVPRAACIGVDYDVGGLFLPEGEWPRLQAALAKDDSTPWDLLLALALLDALAGGGTPFWQEYTHELLPAPELLCLPCCWAPERLQQLQHAAIIQGALGQQERLRGLFPGLSKPMAEDQPTWIQWGFACVRSRAFRLGPQTFAFVPFLDQANHNTDPTCDYRTASGPATPPQTSAPATSGATADSGAAGAAGEVVELVARRALVAGQEATISYTGTEGSTNQRMMAQYGFVPEGGNADDRVELEGAATSGNGGPALSLARIQGGLGDTLFNDAVQRKNRTLFAALKSLPLEEQGDDPGEVSTAEQQLVATLKQQCQQQSQECNETTVAEDEAALASAAAAGDVRLAAAARYRLERKKLLQTCSLLLDVYLR